MNARRRKRKRKKKKEKKKEQARKGEEYGADEDQSFVTFDFIIFFLFFDQEF
jgi:hypothetical protein